MIESPTIATASTSMNVSADVGGAAPTLPATTTSELGGADEASRSDAQPAASSATEPASATHARDRSGPHVHGPTVWRLPNGVPCRRAIGHRGSPRSKTRSVTPSLGGARPPRGAHAGGPSHRGARARRLARPATVHDRVPGRNRATPQPRLDGVRERTGERGPGERPHGDVADRAGCQHAELTLPPEARRTAQRCHLQRHARRPPRPRRRATSPATSPGGPPTTARRCRPTTTRRRRDPRRPPRRAGRRRARCPTTG